MAEWYYLDGRERRGPVSDEAFERMVAAGEVGSDSLVWRDGLDDWAPLRSVRGAGIPPPPPPPEPLPPAALGTVATCSECRGLYPRSEMMQFGGGWVCAGCKPRFVQKLKEGAALGGDLREYAGFWVRCVAKFIDGIILGIGNMLIGFVQGLVGAALGDLVSMLAVTGASIVLQQLIAVIYTAYFLDRHGATPGKMAMGLKVIVADGGKVSFRRAVGRYFAEILSAMLLFVGYIMAGLDEEKRALHDRICETRVIRVR